MVDIQPTDSADSNVMRRLVETRPDRRDQAFDFRAPQMRDGEAVWRLVKACPPLDTNSLYLNLLQCTHFADTCLIAERDGEIRGWVSGYRLPDDGETLFIWQIAVHPDARGQGLARQLLDRLVQLPGTQGVSRMITTITPSNQPSRRLFAAFAERRGCSISERPFFESALHFGGAHESEHLFSIDLTGNRPAA